VQVKNSTLGPRAPFLEEASSENASALKFFTEPNVLLPRDPLRARTNSLFRPLPEGPLGPALGGRPVLSRMRGTRQRLFLFGSGPVLAPSGQSRKSRFGSAKRCPPQGPKKLTLATHGSCLRRVHGAPCFRSAKSTPFSGKCARRGHRKPQAMGRRRRPNCPPKRPRPLTF